MAVSVPVLVLPGPVLSLNVQPHPEPALPETLPGVFEAVPASEMLSHPTGLIHLFKADLNDGFVVVGPRCPPQLTWRAPY